MIKVKKRKILLLPGDGIGPEVIGEVKKIIQWFNKNKSLDFEIEEGLAGGISYDKHGTPITDEVFYKALECEAVILGAVGGPKWDNPEIPIRPEDGILKLRKNLGLFANLRPCKIYPQLIDSSPLKPERIQDVDFIIVRELTGGLYFGKPKRKWENSRGRRAVDTLAYTEKEIERVVRVAFELARRRRKVLHSVDKMNVMETSRLWREVTSELSVEFHDVELHHMLADNAAIQIVTNPSIFDVIVTENMFGDILSDESAVIGGSMGMLPSASLASAPPTDGKKRRRGGKPALYEPIHGSAPDIAGRGIANPMASILSAAMMLRWSFGLQEEADAIEASIDSAISDGYRTVDISSGGGNVMGTSQIGDMIAGRIRMNR